MCSGTLNPDMSIFVFVAITKAWAMRRSGVEFSFIGPGIDLYCKQYFLTIRAQLQNFRLLKLQDSHKFPNVEPFLRSCL